MNLKNKVNLSLIILALLTIISIVFVIYPLFSGIKKNSEELVSQRKNLLSFETNIKNLEKFKTLYQEIEPNLENINTLFVNPEAPVKFISFLETTARDCQVPIKISSTLPSKTERYIWPSLDFQITSISSFPKFLKFLEKLEAGPYLIEIRNLNISKLTEEKIRSEEFEIFSLKDVKSTLSIKVFSK